MPNAHPILAPALSYPRERRKTVLGTWTQACAQAHMWEHSMFLKILLMTEVWGLESDLVLSLFTPSDKAMRKVAMFPASQTEQSLGLLRATKVKQLVQVHEVTDKSLIQVWS